MENKNNNTLRYDWLDSLRTIALLMVIGGHLCFNGIPVYGVITSHVKLPIFYAVSGFLFSKSKLSKPLDFMKNKTLRLLVPFIILIFTKEFFDNLPLIINKSLSFSEYLVRTAQFAFEGGTMLWFIPSLFLCELVLFAVMKLTKANEKALLAISVILIVVGGFTTQVIPILPWRVNAIIIILPFLIFGYLYKSNFDKISKKTKIVTGLMGGVAYIGVLFVCCLLTKKWFSVNINDNFYTFYPISIFLMHVGTACAMLLGPFIPFPNFVKVMGRNTLFYYAYHMPATTNLIAIIGAFIPAITMDYLRDNRILYTAITVSALIILIPFCYGVNKLAPFVVGKKNTETNSIWLKKSKQK